MNKKMLTKKYKHVFIESMIKYARALRDRAEKII